jgi:hypothetical protein
MVDVDETEEVDDMDDDELFLCKLFRGMSMRLRSSGFMIWPPWPPFMPLTPQAGLLCWVKVGGFATAVMGETGTVPGLRYYRLGQRWAKIGNREMGEIGRWETVE